MEAICPAEPLVTLTGAAHEKLVPSSENAVTAPLPATLPDENVAEGIVGSGLGVIAPIVADQFIDGQGTLFPVLSAHDAANACCWFTPIASEEGRRKQLVAAVGAEMTVTAPRHENATPSLPMPTADIAPLPEAELDL